MIKTLAEFIFTVREDKGLSQKGLAAKANIPLSVIESIEAGQELFLATTVRQKLAKALNLESRTIKALEKNINENDGNLDEYVKELKDRILGGVVHGNICPVCKAELICRTAEMYDLEDKLMLHPKARCSKCPFQIR